MFTCALTAITHELQIRGIEYCDTQIALFVRSKTLKKSSPFESPLQSVKAPVSFPDVCFPVSFGKSMVKKVRKFTFTGDAFGSSLLVEIFFRAHKP
jgi:hypothetical protein